ncbi:MAG: DNA repair protein RecN [Blastocatellia bacterium]|nr:DNA repair protein RecN [Blastocatellia bacterium]
MLSLLNIENIALIDSLKIEFGEGLNLLTGETGSGKSIIVDSLGALTGGRVSSDLIKEGASSARIEGMFHLELQPQLRTALDESGIDLGEETTVELIVRRQLSSAGPNRIFINDHLVTANLLKRIGPYLVDIHGQGEQTTLFDPATHMALLDEFASVAGLVRDVREAYSQMREVRRAIDSLEQDEAEKLRLVDVLGFQVEEIRRAELREGELEELEAEKRRLSNVEKLSTLSDEAYSLLYEADAATIATLSNVEHRIAELGQYEQNFCEYSESLKSALAVLDDLAITVRDFRGRLEFSPERLEEIENRLAEISGVTRKYGGTVAATLEHLLEAEGRLANIESAEMRAKELEFELIEKTQKYLAIAKELSGERHSAAPKYKIAVEAELKTVALEKAHFEVGIKTAHDNAEGDFAATGIDRVEFLFSANPGESPKPLAKVTSGGEASRLMLILKTTSRPRHSGKAVVFDEIDAGIGGRVAEAVGVRLKQLAATQQVLCVTHQAQVATKADRHFVVEKSLGKSKTTIGVRELDEAERVEEIARMLAGEKITEAARDNAREMLAGAG